MDEKLIEEISNTTGVPQMLVSRSAQARAEANGVDVNSILSSWSTGSPAAPVATEVVEEAPVATEVAEEVIEPPADLFFKSCTGITIRISIWNCFWLHSSNCNKHVPL